ncbi:MAG: response regulator [bacterium]|nr:response regulator [bacterium]
MDGNKTILLVEDNPDDAELTLMTLRKNRISNEVVVVREGPEALEYLFGTGRYAGRDTSVMPVVVMLDLKLPKLGGLEVLNRIRNNAKTKYLPVVILTSSDEEQDMISSYTLGANSYVRKPVDFVQFQQAVRQLTLYWVLLNHTAPEEGKK